MNLVENVSAVAAGALVAGCISFAEKVGQNAFALGQVIVVAGVTFSALV